MSTDSSPRKATPLPEQRAAEPDDGTTALVVRARRLINADWIKPGHGVYDMAADAANAMVAAGWRPAAQVREEIDAELAAITLPPELIGTLEAPWYREAWQRCRRVVRGEEQPLADPHARDAGTCTAEGGEPS